MGKIKKPKYRVIALDHNAENVEYAVCFIHYEDGEIHSYDLFVFEIINTSKKESLSEIEQIKQAWDYPVLSACNFPEQYDPDPEWGLDSREQDPKEIKQLNKERMAKWGKHIQNQHYVNKFFGDNIKKQNNGGK